MHNRFKNKIQIAVLGCLTLYLSGCIAAAPVVAASAAGTGGANVAGSTLGVGQQYTDLTLKGDIAAMLNGMQGLDHANVEVTVFNGIVLLLGQIPTQDMKNQLASQISALPGVVIVYNQLNVGPNITFTRFADDSWITSKVKANMIGQVNPLHFKVVTQDGIVYLLGQVTEDEGSQAAQVAAQTSGVVKVVKIFNYIYPSAATPTAIPGANAGAASTSAPVAHPVAASPATSQPAPVSASSDSATTVNPLPSNSNAIPQYAPNYALPPDNGAGPASSD